MQDHSSKEVIDTKDPAWPIVERWIQKTHRHVEILPPNKEQALSILQNLQITTHAMLGALIYETGDIFIDHGWLRLYGSGHERMPGGISSWALEDEQDQTKTVLKDPLVIASDIIGGFFVLNGGSFPGQTGSIFYFAPDKLTWEGTGQSYANFMQWILSSDLDAFYEEKRWPGWQQDSTPLRNDQGISIYPFPFMKNDFPLADRSRRVVPLQELWNLHLDLAQQMHNLSPGAEISFHIADEH